MDLSIEISNELLQKTVATQLIKGELGDKVAKELALMQAEIVTYNRTSAAELLNISRTTLYEYENSGQIVFDTDGRISLIALVEFRRSIKGKDEADHSVRRKTQPERKRKVKKDRF